MTETAGLNTEKEAVKKMGNEQKDLLSAADFAAILSTTLALADEAGLSVGVRNRAATASRPAGLLIFIEGMGVADDGRLIVGQPIPQVAEVQP